MLLVSFLLFLLHFPFVFPREFLNVTIDDNDPKIQYTGPWVQSVATDLDYGRSHKVSTEPTAQATFTFQGVAIYFVAPKWPYNVTTAVQVDTFPLEIIDLVDHTQSFIEGGSETVGFDIIWGMVSLDPHFNHTMTISMPLGGRYVVLDSLIYTSALPDAIESTTAEPSSSSTGSPVPPTSGIRTPIIVGAVITSFVVCVGIGMWLFVCIKRRSHRQASLFIEVTPPTTPTSKGGSSPTTPTSPFSDAEKANQLVGILNPPPRSSSLEPAKVKISEKEKAFLYIANP